MKALAGLKRRWRQQRKVRTHAAIFPMCGAICANTVNLENLTKCISKRYLGCLDPNIRKTMFSEKLIMVFLFVLIGCWQLGFPCVRLTRCNSA